jgi:hypothetical protein
LQEESHWSLENNIPLKSGHSLELWGEERVIISGFEWRAIRWSGGVQRPKFFKLFNRSFRNEDLVDIISELLFSPIAGYGSQVLNFWLNESHVTFKEEIANIVPSSSTPPGVTNSLIN